MKVAMAFPAFTGPYGGERKILRLADAIAKKGHKVTVYTPSFDTRCSYLFSPSNVTVVETGFWRMKDWVLYHGLEHFFMSKMAFSIKPDFDLLNIHNHPSLFTVVAGKLTGRFRSLPIVYDCNEPPRHLYDLREEVKKTLIGNPFKLAFYGALAPILRNIDKYALRFVDEIVVLSEYAKRMIRSIYHCDASVVREGIDVDRFTPQVDGSNVRKIHSIKENAPLIVSVNKLHVRKNLETLIFAMPMILHRVPNAKALIVGDGPDRNRLEQLVHDLELAKSVTLTGYVDGSKLPEYFAASDVFVFTALREPMPGSLLEAMACGKPVVATRDGGCVEVVSDGENGLLFPPRDTKMLAENVCILLENRDLGEKLGLNGRRFVEKEFTWERVAEETLKIYERAISK